MQSFLSGSWPSEESWNTESTSDKYCFVKYTKNKFFFNIILSTPFVFYENDRLLINSRYQVFLGQHFLVWCYLLSRWRLSETGTLWWGQSGYEQQNDYSSGRGSGKLRGMDNGGDWSPMFR